MSTHEARLPEARSPALRALLRQQVVDAERIQELGRVQKVLGSAGRALDAALAVVDTSRTSLAPTLTREQIEAWVSADWVLVAESLRAVGETIGTDAQVVMLQPFPPHIDAGVRRGVDIFQGLFAPFTRVTVTDDSIRLAVDDALILFASDSNASFYFKRLVEHAKWRLGTLANRIERDAKTLCAADLASVAELMWETQKLEPAENQQKLGRPWKGDPLKDAALFDVYTKLGDRAEVERQFNLTAREAKLAIDRERKRRQRGGDKSPSSRDNRDKSPTRRPK